MGFVILLRYTDLYDGKTPQIQEVLKGIPSETIISLACYVNAQKHLNPFDPSQDIQIFQKMIERLPKDEHYELNSRLKSSIESIQKAERDFSIFPLSQMLSLIEYVLVNFQEGALQTITSVEEENILKAILILNEELDNKHVGYTYEKSKDKFDQFMALIWPIMLPTNEYTYRKEIVIPIYQSLLLFDYLANHKIYKDFLQTYFAKNNVHTANELLKHIASSYLFSFDKEKKTFFTYYTKEDFERNPVLFQFVREIDKSRTELLATDIKVRRLLREKPILKTTDEKYFITNWNFIIDKIYEGLKRDFFQNSGVKAKLKGNDEREKWNSFTGMINQTFSEKVVFLDVVKRLLNNGNVSCVPENPSRGWNQDLYLRKNNHIVFIEFKDVTLPINENFKTIKNDVHERMIYNEKDGKKKAAYQLVDQIVDFEKNINKFENLTDLGINKERLILYPVIVYTDLNWGMAGVNEYVGRKFNEYLSSFNLKFFAVEQLVMIPLDFLNNYEKIFLEGGYSIHQVIYNSRQVRESYRSVLSFSNDEKDIINAYLDFDFYASRAYKNFFVHPHQISLFNAIMEKLEVPKV
ncbi:MAG: hypothetical protein MUC87_01715 [Bacteroidia bacterium]|jgi:hypothetical protein|nr:hypothetical protein [Bacteroidia bacterium]